MCSTKLNSELVQKLLTAFIQINDESNCDINTHIHQLITLYVPLYRQLIGIVFVSKPCVYKHNIVAMYSSSQNRYTYKTYMHIMLYIVIFKQMPLNNVLWH